MTMPGGQYPQSNQVPPGFAAPGGPAPAMAHSPHGQTPSPTGKEKTPKSARKLASTNGMIAIGLAVAVALAMLVFLGGAEGDSTFVVRARQTLPALAQIEASNLEAVEVPANLVETDAISASSADEAMKLATKGDEAIVGMTPIVPVLEGQQLRPSMFSFDFGQAAPLKPDERLISVSADVGRGVAGNLRVGDHVDVVVVDDQSRIGGVVLQNSEIVAVQLPAQALQAAAQQQTTESGRNSTPGEVLPSNPIPGTYVLRVPADKAVTLAVADTSGSMYLVFRDPSAVDVTTGAVTLLEAICNDDPTCAASIGGASANGGAVEQ